MSGQRDPSKKLLTFWASEEERALLAEASVKAGFDTIADYLRWIAKEQPRPGEMPKKSHAKKKQP